MLAAASQARRCAAVSATARALVERAVSPSFATTAESPASPPGRPPRLALTIDFCASCGYGAWVDAAKAAAVALTPVVTVTGRAVARTGAFEVWAADADDDGGGGDGSGGGTGGSGGTATAARYLAWSKLATGQPVGVEGVPAVLQAAVADARRRLGGAR
jgi:hypothetical protein